jgi:NAD(P)-dependent dehydrogenase (short-subunit alcohol dehydrogenase family)
MRPLAEQTILITGSTDGLGRQLAREVGRSGAQVIIHGRDADRAEQVRDEIRRDSGNERSEVLLADLADLHQVFDLAERIRQRYPRLDVVVNNAGLGAAHDGGHRRVSTDGIELLFAVNYVAGYYLTKQLVPLVVASAPARIINVASVGQRAIDFADPLLERHYDGTTAYCQSKLAQVMFTFDLAEDLRDRQVTVNALHPATYMNTTMVREGGIEPWSTVQEGAAVTLRLMTDPALDSVTGRYYNGTMESRAESQAYDPRARARLRELTDRLISAAVPAG